MTIDLPKDLERFVHAAIRSGRYKREEDVVRDALTRLRQSMPDGAAAPPKPTKSRKATSKKKPLNKEEFHRQLVKIGLMSQLPDTLADYDDPDDQPVDIQGEPLSETVIRERR